MTDRLARILAAVAIIIAALSLGLNAFLLISLNNARQANRQMVDRVIVALDQAATGNFHYNYHIKQTVPFDVQVPIKQDLLFPFKGTIPISTTFPLRMATPLGGVDLNIPINTTFPVDVQVPLKVDQTFPVKMDVPLDMDVPIDLRLDQPPFDALMRDVRAWLVEVRDSM